MNPTACHVPGASPTVNSNPDFQDLMARLAVWKFPEGIDGVVAIASQGIVPGALVAQRLGVGLKTMTVSYRGAVNEPLFAQPKVASSIPGLGHWRRVLLVDDLCITGKSLQAARAHLPKTVDVLPFVFVGDVDYALIRGTNRSINWPWNED